MTGSKTGRFPVAIDALANRLFGKIQDERETVDGLVPMLDLLAVEEDVERDAVADDGAPFPIEQHATQRILDHLPQAVVVRQATVVLPVHHLQVPEVEEVRQEQSRHETKMKPILLCRRRSS
jgi:hypothetical protein